MTRIRPAMMDHLTMYPVCETVSYGTRGGAVGDWNARGSATTAGRRRLGRGPSRRGGCPGRRRSGGGRAPLRVWVRRRYPVRRTLLRGECYGLLLGASWSSASGARVHVSADLRWVLY